MITESWKQDYLKNDAYPMANTNENEALDIKEMTYGLNNDKKVAIKVKSLIDRMFNHFLNKRIKNLSASKGEFSLLRMQEALDLKLDQSFYIDYEFLFCEVLKLCVIIDNFQLMDFYLSFYNSANYYKTEMYYYIAKSRYSKGDVEGTLANIDLSLKENHANPKTLLLAHDVYKNKMGAKELSFYYLKEARLIYKSNSGQL